MTVIRLQRFVRFYLVQHLVVSLGIFARNKGRHAAHRKRAAPVAGLNQQSRVGAEERLVHRHHLTVRQNAIRMILQRFDIAEDVVPAPAVQTHNMVAQSVQNFVHLEYGGQRFDQQRGFDGAARQLKTVFRKAKDFTPPRGFLPGLSLRQIEIGAAAFFQ